MSMEDHYGTCRSCSCSSEMSPDSSKHRMISCSRSAWRNLLTATVGSFSRHRPAHRHEASLVGVEFNAHSTQYRSFRRRSSQPITWLILKNKPVQDNTDKQTQYKSEKVNDLKCSKTKLPWFSCLLQHSARKRSGLILQCPRAHDIQMQSSSPLACPGRERGCLHELHPLRMGDRLRAGIPSRYVASQLGQLSLAYLRFT